MVAVRAPRHPAAQVHTPITTAILMALSAIGHDPADSDDVRLRKALHVGIALLVAVFALFWGVLYVVLGEPVGGAIPLAYTVLSPRRTLLFAITRPHHS